MKAKAWSAVCCTPLPNKALRGENMSGNGVESLKVNGQVITEKEGIRDAIRQVGEEMGGVGEVLGASARKECVTLERKNAVGLNERISREEVEKCVKRQKNGKSASPGGIPYEMYKNGGEVVIDRITELFNQVWEEERVPRMWNECRVTVNPLFNYYFPETTKGMLCC